MTQPPNKPKAARPSLGDIFGDTSQSADQDLARILQGDNQAPAKSFGTKAAETLQDVMAAGLSHIPGAATAYGALSAARGLMPGQPRKTLKEGAQEFQQMVQNAPARSGQALAGPLSPIAIAGGVLPYALGPSSRLAQALYSAALGSGRSAEQSAITGEGLTTAIPKAAAWGAAEGLTGYLAGDPAGAIARSFRTPTRTAQVQAQRESVRQAETPFYEAYTGYTTRGQAPVAAPLSPPTATLARAIQEPVIQQSARTVMKNPDLRGLPITHPAVLDRIYKEIGKKAFQETYSVSSEAAQVARDLLKAGMNESRPAFPYSEVLGVARKGRQIGSAIERGAEALRVASKKEPATLNVALRKGKDAFRNWLKTASPEERTAAIEGAFGYLREAPKTKGFVLPNRTVTQALKMQDMAQAPSTLMQRSVRGAVAETPFSLWQALAPFLTGANTPPQQDRPDDHR